MSVLDMLRPAVRILNQPGQFIEKVANQRSTKFMGKSGPAHEYADFGYTAPDMQLVEFGCQPIRMLSSRSVVDLNIANQWCAAFVFSRLLAF